MKYIFAFLLGVAFTVLLIVIMIDVSTKAKSVEVVFPKYDEVRFAERPIDIFTEKFWVRHDSLRSVGFSLGYNNDIRVPPGIEANNDSVAILYRKEVKQ